MIFEQLKVTHYNSPLLQYETEEGLKTYCSRQSNLKECLLNCTTEYIISQCKCQEVYMKGNNININ